MKQTRPDAACAPAKLFPKRVNCSEKAAQEPGQRWAGAEGSVPARETGQRAGVLEGSMGVWRGWGA